MSDCGHTFSATVVDYFQEGICYFSEKVKPKNLKTQALFEKTQAFFAKIQAFRNFQTILLHLSMTYTTKIGC